MSGWTDSEWEFISSYVVETSDDGINYREWMKVEKPDKTDGFSCEIPLSEDAEGRVYYRVVSNPLYGSQQISNTVSLYVFDNSGGQSPFLSQMLITENWSAAVMKERFQTNPCVVLGTPTYRNKMPLGYRVNHVQNDACDFRLTTWDYQEQPSLAYPDTIALMMTLEGNYDWNGLQVEVGQLEGINDEWKHIEFNQPFDGVPVVIPTQTTSNYLSSSSARVRNVSSTGFDLKLQYEGNNHLPDGFSEKVTFLAVSQGKAIYGGKEIHVGLSGDVVVEDNLLGGTRLEYGASYNSLPLYFAAMQTENDTITSALRIKSRDLTSATLIKDREKAVAHERVKGEQVGWVVIGDTEATGVQAISVKKRQPRFHVSSERVSFDDAFSRCVVMDLNGRMIFEKCDSDFIQIGMLPVGFYIASVDGEKVKFGKTR